MEIQIDQRGCSATSNPRTFTDAERQATALRHRIVFSADDLARVHG